MTRMLRVLMFALLPAFAFGQDLRFGLKAGVPFTHSFEQQSTNPTTSSPLRRYTLGLTGELRFKNGLGFEVDALYKRIGYDETYFCGLRCQPDVISLNPQIDREHEADTVTTTGNSWEFPILAKYRFPVRAHPFVASGASVRHVFASSLNCVSQDFSFGSGVPGGSQTTFTEKPCFGTLPSRTSGGLVLSGGIEVGWRRVHLLPEFRYTRWFQTDPWINLLPFDNAGFTSHQAELLLGITF